MWAQESKSLYLPNIIATLVHHPDTTTERLQIARYAFPGDSRLQTNIGIKNFAFKRIYFCCELLSLQGYLSGGNSKYKIIIVIKHL